MLICWFPGNTQHQAKGSPCYFKFTCTDTQRTQSLLLWDLVTPGHSGLTWDMARNQDPRAPDLLLEQGVY